MAGGLIQLVTTGVQDSPIIGNPEITFFKTVYRQHTIFSICQNDRYIGNLEFGKEGTKVIEKNGDLLYNQTLRLEIPYFEIIKTQKNKELISSDYNINELNVTYMNSNCVVFNVNDTWYIVPEKLFKIGDFEKITTEIEYSKIENKLLPEFIKSTDLGNNVTFYNIRESDSSPIISLLRVESNYWEQFWLDFIDNTEDETYYNALQTLTSTYRRIHEDLRNRIFNLFYVINTSYKFLSEFFFRKSSAELDEAGRSKSKNEVERYFEYINNFNEAIKIDDGYEIDKIYKYCIQNNKNFDIYKEDCLKYTPLVIELLLKLFYSNNKQIFTFWKKFNVVTDNHVNNNILDLEQNFKNEWKIILNELVDEVFQSNNIKNIIFDEFMQKYSVSEENIQKLFLNLNFNNNGTIYSKLKVFMERFLLIKHYSVNFYSLYYPFKYENIPQVNHENEEKSNNYFVQILNQIDNYKNLKTTVNEIDSNEMNNLTPVSVENIYAVFAEELLNIVSKYTFLEKGDISFLVFWKNCVVDLVYKNFIDNYQRTLKNPSLINTESERKLTYYYSLIPGKTLNSSYIHNMWFEIFNKSSWLGTISLGGNQFLKLKENVISINKLLLNDNIIEKDNNFYLLNIVNSYTYRYFDSVTNIEPTDNNNRINIKDVVYNESLNKLYIRYDNNYNKDLITITIRNSTKNASLVFSSANFESIQNEKGFNSLYLVFNLTNNYVFTNNDLISLTATYNNYLPIVNFYDNKVTNPFIKTKKYTYVSKTSTNTLKLFKISSSNELILENGEELNANKNNNVRILTIKYFGQSKIMNPEYFDCELIEQNINTDNYLKQGSYSYAISFYSLSAESDLSDIRYVNVSSTGNNKSFVKLFNIPQSDDKNVIGRKIYRTKANSTDLLLLKTIDNNIDTIFIDKINDSLLGVDYSEGGNVKINILNKTDTTVSKFYVRVNLTSNRYVLEDIRTGLIITVPPDSIPLISDIYLEDFEYPVNLIPNTNFTISKEGLVKLNNSSDFSSDHFYYLTANSNPTDSTKLIPSKRQVVFTNDVSILIVPGSSSLVAGNYEYRISFYNIKTNKESLPNSFSVNLTNSTDIIRLYNFPQILDTTYDSWRLYRKKPDNLYYLLKTINSSLETSFDDIFTDAMLTVKYEEPVFYLSKQINTQTINRPSTFTIVNSSANKPQNFSSGIYKYEITYFSINEETVTSPYVLYNITSFKPELQLISPADSRILGWKIYRSALISNGVDPASVSTKFIGIVNITQMNKTFVDPLDILNPPKINTLLLDPPVGTIIDDSDKNKPLDIVSGLYKYQVTYFGENNKETAKSDPIMFTINLKKPNLTFTLPPNSGILGWKIYRSDLIPTLADAVNYDTKLVGFYNYISTSESQKFTDFVDPITPPIINSLALTPPSNFTIINSTESKPSLFTSGNYKYQVTFIGTNNKETAKSQSVIFNITNFKPILNFIQTSESSIIGWKIYRSDLIPSGQNQENYETKLIGISSLLEFRDQLGEPFIQPTDLIITNSITAKPASFNSGKYKYEITYYGTNNLESFSSQFIYDISTLKPQLIFRTPVDSRVQGIKIYRSKQIPVGVDPNTYSSYVSNLIGIVPLANIGTNFVDPLISLYDVPDGFTIQTPPTITTTLTKPSNFPSGNYKYAISYYGVNNIETFSSEPFTFNITTFKPTLRFTSLISSNIYPYLGWKIYRSNLIPTGQNADNYDMTFVGIVNFSEGKTEFVDELTIPPVTNLRNTLYNIIKIPIKGAAPNLNSFISHSTDYEFANDKKLSDVNDYIFNKPMIMLANNSKSTINTEYDSISSQNSPLLYFYNVNFKINSTSVIRLDNNVINYILPLSSQQFFIKPADENYYKINKITNTIEDKTNLVSQYTFNPAFDEFNLSIEFINLGYYYPVFIDKLCEKYLSFINENPDYLKIFNLIDNSIKEFNKIFEYMLNRNNTFYGLVSQRVIDVGARVNIFYDILKSSVLTLPLASSFTLNSITDWDFVKFTRSALTLQETNEYYGKTFKDLIKDTIDENNYNTFTILTPFYKKYTRRERLSIEYIKTIRNMSQFFVDHINYVNGNIDYLNFSNPNNKENSFLSNNEINQEIKNNYYDYSDNSQITTLHPILDTNIEKLYVTDKNNNINVLTNFTRVNQYEIKTPEYTDIKEENVYDDFNLILNLNGQQKKDKFNYYGIVSLDSNGNFIFDDNFIANPLIQIRYIIFDDKQIYRGNINYDLYRYTFNTLISECQVINPYEIIPSNLKNAVELNLSNTITLSRIVNSSNNPIFVYIYEYNIVFDTNWTASMPNQLSTVFYQDLTRIPCTIKKISDNEIKLYIRSTSLINFTQKKLIFLTDLTTINSITTTPDILSITLTNFKEANYIASISTELLATNFDDVIIKINYDYFSLNDAFIVNLDGTPTEKGIYFYINSTISPITSPLYKKSLNAVAETDTTSNFITYKKIPSFIISNFVAYSNYRISESTRKIIETDDEHYIMLINLFDLRFYISKKKNVKSLQIPEGNYHTWILNKSVIDVIKLDKTYKIQLNGNLTSNTELDFIKNSFYMVKGTNDEECFYYYESGNTISTNSSIIQYYLQIIGSSTTPIDKDEIYLVDNDLFDVINYQFIKTYKLQTCTENFLRKTITNTQSIFDYDTNENLAFNSEYVFDNLNILSNDSKISSYEGSNEFSTNLLFKRKTISPETDRVLLVPVTIKKYENINIPMIKFIRNSITYTNSIIPILMSSLQFNNNTVTLSSTIEIGKITYDYDIKPLSTSLTVSKLLNEYTVSLKSGYAIPLYTVSTINTYGYSTTTWSLQLQTQNGQYIIMNFNIVFVSSLTLLDDYLELQTDVTNKIGFSQPIIEGIDGQKILPNILINYELLNTNIFKSNGNNLELNLKSKTFAIGYKYYEDVRNKNVIDYNHEIKLLNYNGLLNLKPKLIDILNQFNFAGQTITTATTAEKIQTQAIFYVVTYTTTQTTTAQSARKVEVLFNNPQSSILTRLNSFRNSANVINFSGATSSVSISVSFQNPLFINNKIKLVQKTSAIYIVSAYEKLYLEMNEIIFIDGNLFVVKGLNIFNEVYELEIITNTISTGTSTIRKMKYLNNGYYSLGVYYSKENKELPEIQPNNIVSFNLNQTILPGDFYMFQNKLVCSNLPLQTINSQNSSLYGTFGEKSLNVKLFCLNNKYYLCDNFIKIKKMDKIVYVASQNDIKVFTVLNIRNNEIILDSNLELISNQFYNFILPYQPLKLKYVYIDTSGKIITDIEINDKMIIGFQNTEENNKIDLFLTNDSTINNWNKLASHYWIYIFDINYKKDFTNYMNIPENSSNLTIKNQHPIAITTTYDKVKLRFKLNDSTNFISGFNWFYGQPVKINGIYSFITDIIIEKIGQSSNIITNYYIKLGDNVNTLFLEIPDTNLSTIMYISYSTPNINTFYLLNKFRYNYGIQMSNYDMPVGTKIEVLRCALINDELVFMDKTINNKKIIFKYGVSVSQNEQDNDIITNGYQNIYFYNYFMINQDGTISNFDTLTGTYYLHCERDNVTIQRIYLCKIRNGNKIKFYADILNPWNNSHHLSKMICIKLHYTGEYTYRFEQIIQTKNLSDINLQPILIFNSYLIKFKNLPQKINGEFHQEIIFTKNIVDINIYKIVYLDENFMLDVRIIKNNLKYYLISTTLLSNDITNIYTKNINYLVKSQQLTKTFKKANLSDTSLDYYINTKILDTEDLVQNIFVSKIDKTDTKYKYKLIDGKNYVFTAGEKYSVNSLVSVIQNVDINNYVFTTQNPIDVESVEKSNNFVKLRLFTTVSIDVTTYFDQLLLFKSVKHLKLKLLEKCSIKLKDVTNYIKPWNKWGLLCSVKTTSSLKNLLISNTYLKWSNNSVTVIFSPGNDNYSYLTKKEMSRLSMFLETVNKSQIRKNNYIMLNTQIEPLLFKQIEKIINVPEFYFDVVGNINTILESFGYDVYFDGNNIIFNNDKHPPYILEDGENEIAYYLTNEYTFDLNENIVYRNQDSFDNIKNQILSWINKTTLTSKEDIIFGLGINKLLRYIKLFGEQLVNLMNNFSDNLNDTPNYYYLNPLKFLVSKIWEKYCSTGNLVNLEKEFTDKLISTVYFEQNTNKTYNLITTDYLLKINYYGLYYYGYYFNLTYTIPLQDVNVQDIIEYNSYGFTTVEEQNGLIINPVYKYKLNFNSTEILQDCTYSLDFLNGDKINTSVNMGNFSIYPDQINFSSNYNIQPTDFYILNQQKNYKIVSQLFLGYLFKIKFSSDYNLVLVDEVFLNGNNLIINNINISSRTIDLLIPDLSLSTNDVFEFRNKEFIKSYNIINDKVFLEFTDPVFPYVSDKTIILIENEKYYLKFIDGKYYLDLIGFNHFYNYEVEVLNQLTAETVEALNQVLYEYNLNPPITDTEYRPINDNYIVPLEFSIINKNLSSVNKEIKPLHVHTYGDNRIVFHYTTNQNLIIRNTSEQFTEISHKKRIVEDLSNEIVSIEKQDEFLYYINITYPVCDNTVVFVYFNQMDGPPSDQVYDITPEEGIAEPRFNIEDKTSIYFNQMNNSTYFSIKSQYTNEQLKKNVGFIQKNIWEIIQSDYIISSGTIFITMPDNFILSLAPNKSYYKINNLLIQNADISTYDNKLVIKWNPLNGILTGSILFKQYFIETIGNIFKPKENRKYNVKLEYPYQYLPTTNFYMYQYDGESSKFDNYLYLIETTVQNNGISGYFQTTKPKSTMQLISGNKTFNVKILDQVRENNKICYVISYFDKLDINQTYMYHFNDFKMNLVNNIKFYQNGLQFAQFYLQTELNTISLFMNESVNNFKILSDTIPIVNPTKFYLVSYEKSELTNLLYLNEFKQNINMNKIVEYKNETITTNIVPNFGDYSKFFSSIKLFFNDQMVEELNENVYSIDKYLYSTDEKRNQKQKLCEIKFDGKKWILYFPLIFWYSLKSGLSIPVVAMPHTEIRLKYLLNDISYVLENTFENTSNTKYSFTVKPSVNISLVTDYILLDNTERKLFGNNAHEYVIDRYKIYPDTYITSEESIVKCNFKGLIKDIHLISRPSSNKKLTYYPIKNTKYDAKYNDYTKAYSFYLDVLTNGKYRTDEQRNYAVDIEIIKANEIKLALYKASTNKTSSDFFQINRLSEWFSTWSIWSEDLLKYLMYYETKNLGQVTDYKRKEYILSIYLKYQFSNNYEIQTISPVESLLFKANGSALFAERDYTYFTDVVPYQKFKNSLPNGYYTYTFSLHPTDDQHSGHLNFSNFDDMVIKVKSNSLVNSDPYSLSAVLKEYNILRIMSGHSSLAWM